MRGGTNRPRTAAVAVLLALAAAADCGVRPTGVVDGGEPAKGLTKDLRIYYVRGSALQGVTRPDASIEEPNGALKLLSDTPDWAAERGLVNLVRLGPYWTSGTGHRITLHSPGASFDSPSDRLPNGQLVCTLARAQSFLHRDESIRPDDVRVSLDDGERTYGPYQCSQFLT
ncbi:GerMN domain-containing protein [Streptomyces asiaticus]